MKNDPKKFDATKREVAVLFFANGDKVAAVVTDGESVRVMEPTAVMSTPTLSVAISRLEMAGYKIITDCIEIF